MRIALVANRASGGGLDPAPLAAAMDGAEVFGCDEEDLASASGSGRRSGSPSPAATARSARWRSSRARSDVPLAVIPTGTANDFARAHGLPTDPMEAARLARLGHVAAARSSSAGSRTGGRS